MFQRWHAQVLHRTPGAFLPLRDRWNPVVLQISPHPGKRFAQFAVPLPALRLKRQGHAGFCIRVIQRRLAITVKKVIHTHFLRIHLHGVFPSERFSLG